MSQGQRRTFVDVAAIDWVEAYGNYVRIHAAGHAHLVRSTMARMERRLGASNDAPARFIRIHRSALVNIQSITSVEPYGKGMFFVTLRDGSKLVSSRYHQAGLRRLLKMER